MPARYGRGSPQSVAPNAGLYSSFGFKKSATVGVEAVWQALSALWFGAELGARFTDTSFDPLKPWIADIGLAWEFSIGLPNNLVLSWNYNRYGTKFQHVSLDYRWNPGKGDATRDPRKRIL